MKKHLFTSLAMVILTVAFTSCCWFTEDYHGLPQQVTIPRVGGEIVLATDCGGLDGNIINSKMETISTRIAPECNDTIYCDHSIVKGDWLTVYFNEIPRRIRLVAEPNTTGRMRHLVLSVDGVMSYCYINVYQER